MSSPTSRASTTPTDAIQHLAISARTKSTTVTPSRPRQHRNQSTPQSEITTAAQTKTLPDFDTTANPLITAQTLALLASGTFISASEPVVLLGDSGTGKSHLLIGTCIAAAENGHRVRYVTCAQLANELAEAADDLHLSKTVARYGRFDLLAIDELGYVHLDQRAAELLFQILTEREERASLGVASYSPFSEWGRTFTDTRLAAAVIDRITYRAHIIETGTASYRLATTSMTTK